MLLGEERRSSSRGGIDIEHSYDPHHGLHLRRTPPSDPSADPAPPLLFVHGLGESGLCFEPLLRETRLSRWERLAPDLPGYGKSPWGPRRDLTGHADLLGAWLESRQRHAAVVVGHSMGGVIGQILCERHPARVRAFLNVEGNLSLQDCAYSGPAARATVDAFVEDRFFQLLDEIYRKGLEDPPHRGYFASARLCDPRLFHLNAGELVDLSAGEALAERFAALRVPKLFVAGRPGGNAPRSLGLLDEAGIRPRILQPAGHWPFLDHHRLFVDLLLELLEVSPGD